MDQPSFDPNESDPPTLSPYPGSDSPPPPRRRSRWSPDQPSSPAGESDPNGQGRGSSPDSDSDGGPPVGLVKVLAGFIGILTDGASIWTRRRIGIDLGMRVAEAEKIAKPIARIISRRLEIKRDLADIGDGVQSGGSLVSYAKRIALAIPADVQLRQRSQETGVLHSDDRPDWQQAPPQGFLSVPAPPPPVRQVAPPPPPPPGTTFHERGGGTVVGSGPAKTGLLGGWED